jgi:hypothetical protein
MDAMLLGPGRFKDKVTPPAGADLQTEFLCFLGRDAAPLHSPGCTSRPGTTVAAPPEKLLGWSVADRAGPDRRDQRWPWSRRSDRHNRRFQSRSLSDRVTWAPDVR